LKIFKNDFEKKNVIRYLAGIIKPNV